MSAPLNLTAPERVVIHFEPSKLRMTDQEFFEFCQLNPELRIERSSEGDITVMAPTGGKTGRRNAKLVARVTVWAEKDGTGQVFDSSTVFSLPNGAKRSPDVSWVRNERWNALTSDQQEQFPPMCPDFVVELRSRTDAIGALSEKMVEYVANGTQLGWLIDPYERRVHVFRVNAPVEILENPGAISGEPLLKELSLNVGELWD